MFSTIYIENEVLGHYRVKTILQRFPEAQVINCDRYGEIFNRKRQNFRLQKQMPALILANKFDNFIHEAPASYGLGGKHNYYFSHMLNCLYDCRYCFLQGMFRSSNYVLFVNYENFAKEITTTIKRIGGEPIYFYSGFDCDSLAMEPVSKFTEFFLPIFSNQHNAWLELRTKSTQIRSLLAAEPFDRCIVAFSFSPENISRSLEHKVPNIDRRIEAMQRLQQRGWNIGLRFDPMIYQHNFEMQYRELFKKVFSALDPDRIHSISMGTFRMPEGFFKNTVRLYPYEKLFAQKYITADGLVSYGNIIETQMMDFCRAELRNYAPEEKLFYCQN